MRTTRYMTIASTGLTKLDLLELPIRLHLHNTPLYQESVIYKLVHSARASEVRAWVMEGWSAHKRSNPPNESEQRDYRGENNRSFSDL